MLMSALWEEHFLASGNCEVSFAAGLGADGLFTVAALLIVATTIFVVALKVRLTSVRSQLRSGASNLFLLLGRILGCAPILIVIL